VTVVDSPQLARESAGGMGGVEPDRRANWRRSRQFNTVTAC